TSSGGASGFGTLFRVSTNGAAYHTLYTFTGGSAGRMPYGGLTAAGTNLYGTTMYGGTNNAGNIFRISTNGVGYADLYEFSGGNDGTWPMAGLLLLTNTLYGTAALGGSNDEGTIFALGTNGANFTVLHTFSALS